MTDKPDFIAKFTLEKREAIPVTFKISPQTANYEDLINKPQINHVELIGDKSTEDLHIDVDIDERVEAHNQSEEAHPFIQQRITDEIAQEREEREAADTAETEARIAADNAEKQAREAADAAEAQIRRETDEDLQRQIDEKGGDIAQERAERIAADQQLQRNIDAEEQARISADNTERSERTSADQQLQANINSEAQTRAQADIALQANITAEERARAAEDAELSERINTEVNARETADTDLQNQIDTKQPMLTADNAGEGISITGSGANVKINNTRNSAEWGNITGDIEDQTDLQEALNDKWQAGTGAESLVTKGNADNGGQAIGNYSVAEGFGSDAKGNYSHVEGQLTTANGDCAHAEGQGTTARGNCSHTEGIDTIAQNQSEHAEGQYNKSHIASNTFGNAGNTIHSVGIGTGAGSLEEQDRRNAIEIMQNGDVYLYQVGGYNGADIENAKTLQEMIGHGGEGTAYASLSRIKDYLYNTTYINLDYDYAKKYFQTRKPQLNIGGCSTVRKGSLVGRNYDWSFNTQVSFVLRTPRNDGKFATLGIASSIPTLTKDFMESGEYDEEAFKVLPFFCTDALNEYGVTSSMLVVPAQKGIVTGTIPAIEQKDELCVLMLCRYIADYFKTAQEAVEYIRDYVSVYSLNSLKLMGYEIHFMISDAFKSYSLEFVNNTVVINEITSKPYMTNFYLDGVSFADEAVAGIPVGGVYTPATVSQGYLPTSLGLTTHADGLERFNMIVNAYPYLNSVEAMQQFMCGGYDVPTLRYTQSYRAQTYPQWDTEFAGHWEWDDTEGHHEYDLTVDSPSSDYTPVKDHVRPFYEAHVRDGKVWQTEHSSVYDLAEKKLYVQVQEDGEWLEFDFNYYTREEANEIFGTVVDYTRANNTLALKNKKGEVISSTEIIAGGGWTNLDGGTADSVYLVSQRVDGGGANDETM